MKYKLGSVALMMGLGLLVGKVKANEPTYENLCRDYSLFGEQIMTKRQNGDSIRDVLEVTQDDPFAEYMTQQAWLRPGWHTDDRRKAAITEFGNEMYLSCRRVFIE